MTHKKLETYNVFPIVAWVIFIGFAVFVYTITLKLQATSESLYASSVDYHQLNSEVGVNSARLDALEASMKTAE